jgi:hypothetical protein
MSKIRIPRKKKKPHVWRNIVSNMAFPNVAKVERYYAYFNVEWGIKRGWIITEPNAIVVSGLPYTKDSIVWWYWVRRKHLGIEPKMSKEIQEYWDFFVSKGIIN